MHDVSKSVGTSYVSYLWVWMKLARLVLYVHAMNTVHWGLASVQHTSEPVADLTLLISLWGCKWSQSASKSHRFRETSAAAGVYIDLKAFAEMNERHKHPLCAFCDRFVINKGNLCVCISALWGWVCGQWSPFWQYRERQHSRAASLM